MTKRLRPEDEGSQSQPQPQPPQQPLLFHMHSIYDIRAPNDGAPIIQMFGVTQHLHESVCVRVYGFEPYLWIKAPEGWLHEKHADTLKNSINREMWALTKTNETVIRLETHQRQSLMHYSTDCVAFIKVVVRQAMHISKLRSMLLEKSLAWTGGHKTTNQQTTQYFAIFEGNVDLSLRFMVDCDIGACNWLTIAQYTARPPSHFETSCVIEVDCHYRHVKSVSSNVPLSMTIAPFKVLSFDIECKAPRGLFPDAARDPVIQIANQCIAFDASKEISTTTTSGENNNEILSKVVFTLHSCAPIAGADVRAFETEKELLMGWVKYLQDIDPDILTGYNIQGFDLPYLHKRAQALGIADQCNQWGRTLRYVTRISPKLFSSKQMGNRAGVEIDIPGRIILDMIQVIRRDHKLRSYSLNAVSHEFLGAQKEDVHHSEIAHLQDGTSETRRRLAVYCLKDALLPLQLMEKLMVVVNLVEMARVTGVPMEWLLERGQNIKVFSQILRKGRDLKKVFPTVMTLSYSKASSSSLPSAAIGYKGATVIPPKVQFYVKHPIVTLDFASLYPSIMIAHNLCFSTLLRSEDVSQFEPKTAITMTPAGHHFVKSTTCQGILPMILEELLSARKEAKRRMKNESPSSLLYKVLNGRQLALKISANSVYGFTGASMGKLPCLPISESVTAFGREMIEYTKATVEHEYPGSNVVYGDTDSVMIEVSLQYKALVDAMAFGKDAAERVSRGFVRPIKLEFEKVYWPYLLLAKKRYAGVKWTSPDHNDGIDAKGIEVVRRDNCPLVVSVISGALNRMLLNNRSVTEAVEYIKGKISDLLMGRIDISELVITKAFSKEASEYKSEQVHLAVAHKMATRDPGSAPQVGDRVAYVIIKGHKSAKSCEKGEDPLYVLKHNIPIDVDHYLEHFLRLPLERIFVHLPTAQLHDLLHGPHTLRKVIHLPDGGGLMKFVTVVPQCLGCKVSLRKEEGTTHPSPLCPRCEKDASDIYGRLIAKRNHTGNIFAKAWTHCQRCQESLIDEVICSNRDCSIFYLRTKAQYDLKLLQSQVDRFGVPAVDDIEDLV